MTEVSHALVRFLEVQYKSDFYADTVFRLGAAYLVRENIQLTLLPKKI
jgi:hypothetical protein